MAACPYTDGDAAIELPSPRRGWRGCLRTRDTSSGGNGSGIQREKKSLAIVAIMSPGIRRDTRPHVRCRTPPLSFSDVLLHGTGGNNDAAKTAILKKRKEGAENGADLGGARSRQLYIERRSAAFEVAVPRSFLACFCGGCVSLLVFVF